MLLQLHMQLYGTSQTIMRQRPGSKPPVSLLGMWRVTETTRKPASVDLPVSVHQGDFCGEWQGALCYYAH